MFYKIYFWFYLAFTGLMLLSLSNSVNVWFLILTALELILLTALFFNAYKKDFFSTIFWKISFVYAILIGAISILFDFIHAVNTSTKSNLTISLVVVIGLTLFSIPAYISLYVYVFKKRKVSFKFKINKQKLWKIYFWFFLLIAIEAFRIQGIARNLDIIDLVISAIAILGLYAFCWNKKILTQVFWKIFFLINIPWSIILAYIIPPSSQLIGKLSGTGMTITPSTIFLFSTIGLILFLPLFLATYFYAFKSDKIWENDKSKKIILK